MLRLPQELRDVVYEYLVEDASEESYVEKEVRADETPNWQCMAGPFSVVRNEEVLYIVSKEHFGMELTTNAAEYIYVHCRFSVYHISGLKMFLTKDMFGTNFLPKKHIKRLDVYLALTIGSGIRYYHDTWLYTYQDDCEVKLDSKIYNKHVKTFDRLVDPTENSLTPDMRIKNLNKLELTLHNVGNNYSTIYDYEDALEPSIYRLQSLGAKVTVKHIYQIPDPRDCTHRLPNSVCTRPDVFNYDQMSNGKSVFSSTADSLMRTSLRPNSSTES